MAIDLVAVLRLSDDLTRPLRQVSRQMTNFSNTARSVGSTVGGMGSAIGRQANELTGLKSQIVGVAGAYLGAEGAIKAFHETIGAAAQYEASEVAVKAIFNDDEASSAYLKMVDSMALDSPLLNSKDMLSSSKGLVAMTKNVDELGKAWSIVERLQVLDPTQGTDGAAFALKEMWQGDALSMVERFGLDKKALNQIKKMAIPEQVAAISALLDGMGVTQSTVDAMGKTTLGYWSQIGERTETFMRTIGNMGNSKIGDVLGGIVTKLDNIDLDSLAAKVDNVIGNGVQKVIDFGKRVWELREPILSAAAVVGTFVGSVAGIVVVAKTIMGIGAAIAFFASPIGLIATAITAAVYGFKQLNEHGDKFRGVLENINDKIAPFRDTVTTMFDGLKVALGFEVNTPEAPKVAGDTGATMLDEGNQAPQSLEYLQIADRIKSAFSTVRDAVLPVFDNIKAGATIFVDFLRTKSEQLAPTFETLKGIFSQVWGTISSVFSSAWSIISPILSGLWSILQVVGQVAVVIFNNVIIPALGFAAQAFATLWSIASPILQLLAAGFEVLMAAVKILWENVLIPFIGFVTTGVKSAFEGFTDALSIIQGAFDGVSSKVSTVYDKIRDFAGMLSNVKLPSWVTNGVSAAVNFVGDVIGSKPKGSHYNGLDNVPYDGYVATLHRGERVQTAQEVRAEKANGGLNGGITINMHGTTIREDADIDKIAMGLAKAIERHRFQIS